jgi:CheY-like chemotaxis protein
MIVAGVDLERRCLAAALRDAGHRVVELNDAEAALTTAMTQPPLAIIADADVRGRTSEELTRRIRAQSGDVAATPILQLVAPTATRVMKTTFATSADARAMKPVRAEDLVAELGRLLIMGPRLRAAREGLAKLEGSSEAVLRGDLGTVPIEGLLTMLEIERRTGFVRISTPRGTVGLELASGAVARGSFGGEMVPALDAMRRLAGVDEGPFSFHALPPRAAPPEAQPLHLLLRASLKMVRRVGDDARR